MTWRTSSLVRPDVSFQAGTEPNIVKPAASSQLPNVIRVSFTSLGRRSPCAAWVLSPVAVKWIEVTAHIPLSASPYSPWTHVRSCSTSAALRTSRPAFSSTLGLRRGTVLELPPQWTFRRSSGARVPWEHRPCPLPVKQHAASPPQLDHNLRSGDTRVYARFPQLQGACRREHPRT